MEDGLNGPVLLAATTQERNIILNTGKTEVETARTSRTMEVPTQIPASAVPQLRKQKKPRAVKASDNVI